ncbi:cytochrome c peroxidase [Mucilaginibacter sp. CAU 1740]|uniref:cytochrome-c peroxidase n=1 Tax=Mucilaginibacter sp. CAU 1740 TaxID=3140365 RepID=UPI00325A9263
MKLKLVVIGAILNLIIGFTAYNLQPTKINYNSSSENATFKRPPNFPEPSYDFEYYPVTPAGFKLGRLLFYEPLLSLDQSITCANCHQSFAAFSNLNFPVSHGIKQCAGSRNTPALFNLAWDKSFMWDGSVHDLRHTVNRAITNRCELAIDLNIVSARLQTTEPYPLLFDAAFKSVKISPERVVDALTQFMCAMVSSNSRYDKYARHERGADFTEVEKQGYVLFKKKCNTCHAEPLFTDHSYRSNGLDLQSGDYGRFIITNSPNDKFKFRVPSLRNVEVTAPYMHDGRFATLKDVMAHYSNGISQKTNPDIALINNGVTGLRLSNDDQTKIVAFLKTLTDKGFINDKRFQIP